MTHRLPILVALAACALPFATTAAAEPAGAPERLSLSVPLSGLDLSSAAGVEAAHARIRAAAGRLCRRFEDSRLVSSRETLQDCIRETVQAAGRQLGAAPPSAVAATAPGR